MNCLETAFNFLSGFVDALASHILQLPNFHVIAAEAAERATETATAPIFAWDELQNIGSIIKSFDFFSISFL